MLRDYFGILGKCRYPFGDAPRSIEVTVRWPHACVLVRLTVAIGTLAAWRAVNPASTVADVRATDLACVTVSWIRHCMLSKQH